MEKAIAQLRDGKILVGDSPKLIVDLDKQEAYIEVDGKKISYDKKIQFSPDLLQGKRKNVLQSAMNYHYRQACSVAEGVRLAEEYRTHANTTVREIK